MKTKKNVTKKVESDHNIIEVKLDLQWKSKSLETLEVFNFKDKESQLQFFNSTNKTEDLSKIFDSGKSLQVQTKKFIKRLNGFMNENFKKVKIKSTHDSKLEELYNKRRYLRIKNDDYSVNELEKVEAELAEKYSEKMYKKIETKLKAVKSDEGGYNLGHLWKLKN